MLAAAPPVPGPLSNAFSSAMSVVGGAAQGLANELILVVESQVTPTYTYDPAVPAAAGTSNPAYDAWVQLAKPRVRLLSRSGAEVARYEPAGPPQPEKYLKVTAFFAAVGAVGTGYVLYRGVTSFFGNKAPAPPKANPGRRRRRARSRARAW